MMYESRLSGSAYWDALSNYDKYKLGKNLDFLSRKDILRTYLTAGLSGRTLCARSTRCIIRTRCTKCTWGIRSTRFARNATTTTAATSVQGVPGDEVYLVY